MAKPTRKKRFPLFDDIAELVDDTLATGQYAFRAGQPTSAPPTRNAAASAPTPYEPAIDLVLLDMSLEGGRVPDEELVRNVPLDNINLITTVSAPRKVIFKREVESFISIDPDDDAADTQPDKGKTISVRKRSAPPTNTGNKRRKVRRISAWEGMTAMAGSMENAFDTLKGVMDDAVQRTTHSEAIEIENKAMEIIQNDEGFSKKDVVVAASAILTNPRIANMYLQIKDKTTRRQFLLHQMEKLKGDD